MLTLNEAIKHCHEKARELRLHPLMERMDIEDVAACEECAEEHEQLAGWLEELKRYRETDYLRQQYEKYTDMEDSSPLKADLVSYCKGLEDGRKIGSKEYTDPVIKAIQENNTKYNERPSIDFSRISCDLGENNGIKKNGHL